MSPPASLLNSLNDDIGTMQRCSTPRLQLEAALDLLPDDMLVEVHPSVGISAETVAALRLIDPIPANIVVGIPQQRAPESVVKVDKIAGL